MTVGQQEAGAGSPFLQKRRRTVVTVLVALLLAGGAWFLVGEAATWSKLASALQTVNPWWLVLSALGSALGYIGYASLFRVESRISGGPTPAFGICLRLTVLIFGASVLATSAGRLGSEFWALRRMNEPAPQAWSRVLAINTFLWACLAAAAAAGSVVALLGSQGVPTWLALMWLLVPAGLVVPAWVLSSPSKRHLARDVGGRTRRTLAAALRGLVLIRLTVAGRRTASEGVFAGGFIWGGELLTLWASLRAFGVDLGYAPLVVGYATGFASSVIPLPAGGAGGVDAASAYALTLVGVPLGPALLATLVQRMCTYWLPLAVAVPAARSVKRLSEDLSKVPRGRPSGHDFSELFEVAT